MIQECRLKASNMDKLRSAYFTIGERRIDETRGRGHGVVILIGGNRVLIL